MDHEAIRVCIDHYFRAGDQGNADALRAAFHPSAPVCSVGPDGALATLSQPEFEARVTAAGPRPARERHIDWIGVAGDAAAATVRSEYETFAFVDFMSLLRIDGRWQIVAKTFHRAARP